MLHAIFMEDVIKNIDNMVINNSSCRKTIHSLFELYLKTIKDNSYNYRFSLNDSANSSAILSEYGAKSVLTSS